MNFFAFLQSIAYNEKLKNKLLGGKKLKKPEVQEMLLSMTNLKKIESYTNEDHYLVESVKEILEDNRVILNDKQLTEQLTLFSAKPPSQGTPPRRSRQALPKR